MRPRRQAFLAVVVLSAAPVIGRAQPAAERRAHAHGQDVYLAGPEVDVTQDVPGDLVAAGGTVRAGASVAESAILAGGSVAIDGAVGDDVMAAGGDVVLRGHAGDDARLAGGTVRIAGRVDDDLTAAGGRVRVERDGVVGGRAFLAGGEIVVSGTVGRLRATGERVTIEGTVRGDVDAKAGSLEIGPTARIAGDVRHRGPQAPRIDPAARIGGRVEHQPSGAPRRRVFSFIAWLLLLPALLLTGAVAILVFPRFTPAAAEAIGTDPWRSLGIGALVLLGAPLLVVALLVTAIGFPLGLVLLAGYLVALLVGYLVAALFLGAVVPERLRGRREAALSKGALVLRLLAALVVLGILRLVPILGALVSLAALVFGLGGLSVQLYRTYRGSGRAQPGAAG
ncbi:MAG TPA: hypothetical protein VIV57_17400 [Anaeromyxobacter sp.]